MERAKKDYGSMDNEIDGLKMKLHKFFLFSNNKAIQVLISASSD